MKANKTRKYSKKVRFAEDNLEYTISIVKKKRLSPWWLLLLLPLLLLIKCNHNIDVHVIDPETNRNLSNVDVSMSYTDHYLFNDGEFLNSNSQSQTVTTNIDGNATFEDIGCSVYSYIFHCMSQATFTLDAKCNKLNDAKSVAYHYTWSVELEAPAIKEDLSFTVVDKETKSEIVDAGVLFSYYNPKKQADSLKTNSSGVFDLKQLVRCGTIDSIKVSAYGYADTTLYRISVLEIINNDIRRIIELRPLKESFDFFVLNKITKQPIPNAQAEVIILDNRKGQSKSKVRTNVDGKGKGFYDHTFVLAQVDITASKLHYKDGKFEGNYTVGEFAKLPDSLRVVYLEPEKYVVAFRNIDSLTKAPISGVNNTIRVVGLDGSENEYVEESNRNGYFDVAAMEGEEIHILSVNQPMYFDKKTYIKSFLNEKVIEMKPRMTSLSFSTVYALDYNLLENCELEISSSNKRIATPSNSGNGRFVVNGLLLSDNISIVASKNGFKTNSYTINNIPVAYLMKAPDKAREIPLEIDLPPCQAGSLVQSISGIGKQVKSYSLGKVGPGRFVFEFDTYNIPDQFIIYNCAENEIINHKPIFDSGLISTHGTTTRTINFVEPIITVISITSEVDSSWESCVHCPE